jgi:hydrogenase expression/formation protein HypE
VYLDIVGGHRMPDTGKIDADTFDRYIASRLGADRPDVQTGPAPGVDFGVVDLGTRALVLATDPISILPELGPERAGRFAVRFVLADVAVSGLAPAHLSISLTLPPSLAAETFDAVWAGVDAECRELGVSVTTGHTGRYAGASLPWVGGATALAVGPHDSVVYPDGTRPGDAIVLTKGPAVETTGMLTTLFPDEIDLPPDRLALAQARLGDTGVVEDALAASEAGAVHAMHDATEGGVLGALHEMAASAGVGLEVETEPAPLLPGVRATCETLSMDPWTASTGGTLVLAVDPADAGAVRDALEARDTPAAVLGTATDDDRVLVDGAPRDPPEGDASWPVFERLREHSA